MTVEYSIFNCSVPSRHRRGDPAHVNVSDDWYPVVRKLDGALGSFLQGDKCNTPWCILHRPVELKLSRLPVEKIKMLSKHTEATSTTSPVHWPSSAPGCVGVCSHVFFLHSCHFITTARPASLPGTGHQLLPTARAHEMTTQSQNWRCAGWHHLTWIATQTTFAMEFLLKIIVMMKMAIEDRAGAESSHQYRGAMK